MTDGADGIIGQVTLHFILGAIVFLVAAFFLWPIWLALALGRWWDRRKAKAAAEPGVP